MVVEQLSRVLRPVSNIYGILVVWSLAGLSLYLCFKPMTDYAASIGLKSTPIVLDTVTYYTPEEGYQILSTLGEKGRNAYRWTNYADFAFPLFLALSVSLPQLALGQSARHLVPALTYLIFDYLENVAEKYVLEIYPKRNDQVMTLACYLGIVKMLAINASLLLLVIGGLGWLLTTKSQSGRKQTVKNQ